MSNKLSTRKLIIIISIIFLIILAAAYLLIGMKNPFTSVPDAHNATQNFTAQQMKALQITLEANVTKTILNGKNYKINGITIDAYKINDTPMTVVDLRVENKDGSDAGYMTASVDLQNNSVVRTMAEPARPW